MDKQIEQKRGCGYRKQDGLYLICTGKAIGCDRLNYNLEVCPVCGAGIKFTRGFTWIDWFGYAGKHQFGDGVFCRCGVPFESSLPSPCPICNPEENNSRYGLLWVGNKYYTPEEFIREAETQGISKRIATVPKDLVFGKTWILFAHKKAGKKEVEGNNTLTKIKEIPCPAIFFVAKAERVEKIISGNTAKDEEAVEKLRKRGITPVIATNIDEKGNVLETEALGDNNDEKA